jgi:predicted RNA-binding protein YlqC (UPF0109 family)
VIRPFSPALWKSATHTVPEWAYVPTTTQVDPDGPRVVIFGPTQESVEAAREMLEFVTQRVSVRSEQMGWLIGRNGRNFRELQDKTKVTRLNIDKGSGQVVLVGLKSAVEAALLYMDTHLQYLSEFESEARESEKLRQELRGISVTEDESFNYGGQGTRGLTGEGRGSGRGRGSSGRGSREGNNRIAKHAHADSDGARGPREQPSRDGPQRSGGNGGGAARGQGVDHGLESSAAEVGTAPKRAADEAQPKRAAGGGRGVATRGAGARGSSARGRGRANGHVTPAGAPASA